MKIANEVGFKLAAQDYCYLKQLVIFYYEQGVIARPTVHTFARFATIKQANDWIQIESIALQERDQRQRIINHHMADYDKIDQTKGQSQTKSRKENNASTIRKKQQPQKEAAEYEDPTHVF
jgi:hypothetical protein